MMLNRGGNLSEVFVGSSHSEIQFITILILKVVNFLSVLCSFFLFLQNSSVSTVGGGGTPSRSAPSLQEVAAGAVEEGGPTEEGVGMVMAVVAATTSTSPFIKCSRTAITLNLVL